MTVESTTSPREERLPWAAMAGIIATVTVFAAAQGLTYPLLSFILERQGTTPDLIGLSAAMTPLGFVVSAPFIPARARRIGLAIEVIGMQGDSGEEPDGVRDLASRSQRSSRGCSGVELS